MRKVSNSMEASWKRSVSPCTMKNRSSILHITLCKGPLQQQTIKVEHSTQIGRVWVVKKFTDSFETKDLSKRYNSRIFFPRQADCYIVRSTGDNSEKNWKKKHRGEVRIQRGHKSQLRCLRFSDQNVCLRTSTRLSWLFKTTYWSSCSAQAPGQILHTSSLQWRKNGFVP